MSSTSTSEEEANAAPSEEDIAMLSEVEIEEEQDPEEPDAEMLALEEEELSPYTGMHDDDDDALFMADSISLDGIMLDQDDGLTD